ncbi:MAG: hypothetical protein NTZ84_03265 [Candidatus Nealsonbacteria bacterium]|nr:hypothetical protein [Candidatus Nealsonbacteria bacterium]
MAIKLIYTLFLALLVALFVGLGISSFYPGPKAPQYPLQLDETKPGCDETAEYKTIRAEFNQSQQKYMEESKPYNRNVSIVSLVAAIIILVSSLTLLNKIKMIADGILLGGVFTTMYSIIRGLMSEDSQFRFLIVTVGLLIALVLGYVKFIRPKETVS